MNRENSLFLGDSASPESMLTGRLRVGWGKVLSHTHRTDALSARIDWGSEWNHLVYFL